jgi:hypothetical protein
LIRKGRKALKGSGDPGSGRERWFGTGTRADGHEPDPGGCEPPGAGELSVERLPARTSVVGKQQVGNVDLAMVAWKRAVRASERKAAVTSQSREG